jgi:hypothetical protein
MKAKRDFSGMGIHQLAVCVDYRNLFGENIIVGPNKENAGDILPASKETVECIQRKQSIYVPTPSEHCRTES